MVNDIAIWGTGRVGAAAYFYYRDVSNIVCYLDNDERKWGKTLNGIKICSPSILRNQNVKIVLAMKRGTNTVRKQLYEEYQIDTCVIFRIDENVYTEGKRKDGIEEDTCIVLFSGGLGNQMFQYAFLRVLQQYKKTVMGYLASDIGNRDFCLLKVFKNISFTICTEDQKLDLIKQNIKEGQRAKKFLLYTEESINEVENKTADLSILNVSGGIFSGLYQTHKFPAQVRSLLIKDFIFESNCEDKLKSLANHISSQDSVGIHIRRGDYLKGNNCWIYGDICTEEYYENAMSYLMKKDKNCRFVFFSNDIVWVKEHYQLEQAIYIEDIMFDHYQDWYDMYLMSICKHNIIANSTFSWWGAWLNQNKNKIVIAPKKWVNSCEYQDIYPESWVKM